MKIVVALRQWKRPKAIRKRLFHRRSSTEKCLSSILIESHESETPVRRSIEKLVYVPEIVELKSTLPPTYDECVDYAPPLHPPPPPQLTEAERGRPRELLYKLQLNDLRQRRPRRPSPPARRPINPEQLDITNYRELAWNLARAAAWDHMFEVLKYFFLTWLVVKCIILALM